MRREDKEVRDQGSSFQALPPWSLTRPKQKGDVKTESRRKRALRYGAAFAAIVILLALGRVPLLREIASFLIIEDSLEPAAAIVALGGVPPFREMEAARLYHAGWAPRVVIVRGARREDSRALQDMGIEVAGSWEAGRRSPAVQHVASHGEKQLR